MKILILMILFTPSAFSQTREDIAMALEQMQKSGMFTPEQIKKAKRELAGWDDSKVAETIKKAKKTSQDPAVRQKALEISQKLNGH